MNTSRTALRILFRHIFNLFYKKTDKILHKDLQCQWVLICRLLHSIVDNLEYKGDMELLVKEIEHVIALLVKSNRTAAMIMNNQEKSKRDELDRNMIEQLVKDYNNVLAMTANKLHEMIGRAMEGRLSKDDISFLKDRESWPLMAEGCVRVFLTKAFVDKTIDHFQARVRRIQRLNR